MKPEKYRTLSKVPEYAKGGEAAANVFYTALYENFEVVPAEDFDKDDFGALQRSGTCAVKNLLVYTKNHLRRVLQDKGGYPAGVEAYKRLDFLLKLDAAQGALSLAMLATDPLRQTGVGGKFFVKRGFELPRTLVSMVQQAVPSMAKRVGGFPSGAQRLACVLRAARAADEELLKSREALLVSVSEKAGTGEDTCPAYREERAAQLKEAFPPGWPGSELAKHASSVALDGVPGLFE